MKACLPTISHAFYNLYASHQMPTIVFRVVEPGGREANASQKDLSENLALSTGLSIGHIFGVIGLKMGPSM